MCNWTNYLFVKDYKGGFLVTLREGNPIFHHQKIYKVSLNLSLDYFAPSENLSEQGDGFVFNCWDIWVSPSLVKSMKLFANCVFVSDDHIGQ